MSITLGRIDYRLLHGIVATMWAPQSGAQRIMIIDDKVANDPIIKEVCVWVNQQVWLVQSLL